MQGGDEDAERDADGLAHVVVVLVAPAARVDAVGLREEAAQVRGLGEVRLGDALLGLRAGSSTVL